ncbi:MAG TPA: phosphate ABC transporter permease PstA [Candidatus Dormibacteraeota bacterium]|jgi:phosphate transport system permease protein|nr:phosphate ABC transporter permease PstA [Candidatus Dormibacteraeota bacterium]
MTRDARRRIVDGAARTGVYLMAALALIPLALVLLFTIQKGWPAVSHVEFFIHSYRPQFVGGAGVEHAIVGSLMMVAMASLLAIPLGVIGGIHLAEYSGTRWAAWVRLSADVLVGTPSIAIGLLAYSLIVLTIGHFSALAGAIALAVLMLPVVMRTTEGALSLVPHAMRESALALGMPRWRVSVQVMLLAGLPGVITGALLAVSRAAGETAPLLFTTFGSQRLNLDPTQPMMALPLIIYKYALTPYQWEVDQAWGAALVLVILALGLNLGSRVALRRQTRMIGRV